MNKNMYILPSTGEMESSLSQNVTIRTFYIIYIHAEKKHHRKICNSFCFVCGYFFNLFSDKVAMDKQTDGQTKRHTSMKSLRLNCTYYRRPADSVISPPALLSVVGKTIGSTVKMTVRVVNNLLYSHITTKGVILVKDR